MTLSRTGCVVTITGLLATTACTPNGASGRIDGAPPLFVAPSAAIPAPATSPEAEQVLATLFSPASGSTALGTLPRGDLAYARNELVGKYIFQSDQLCAEYLKSLTQYQRTNNLVFGSLSTVLGGIGGVVGSAAQPLSAAAGIASAERAEVEAAAFAQSTAQVVAAGIKTSRLRTYNDIVQNKFPKPIQEWPIYLALADVQDYHQKCSLHEGLLEATQAVNAAPVFAPPAVPGAPLRVAGPQELINALQAKITAGAVTGAAEAQARGLPAATGAALGAAAGAAAPGGPMNAAGAGAAAVSEITVVRPPPVPAGTAASRSRLFVALGAGPEGKDRPDPIRRALLNQCWKELLNPVPTNFTLWSRSASSQTLDSITNCITRKASSSNMGR